MGLSRAVVTYHHMNYRFLGEPPRVFPLYYLPKVHFNVLFEFFIGITSVSGRMTIVKVKIKNPARRREQHFLIIARQNRQLDSECDNIGLSARIIFAYGEGFWLSDFLCDDRRRPAYSVW